MLDNAMVFDTLDTSEIFQKPINWDIYTATIKYYVLGTEFSNILKSHLTNAEFTKEFKKIVNSQIDNDREFILIDKDKVISAINNPSKILTIFEVDELLILIEQLLNEDLINNAEYLELKRDPTQLISVIGTTKLEAILNIQYNYRTKIPNIKDLEDNGLTDSIINTVKQNPELLISNEAIKQVADEYLVEKFRTEVFLSYDDIDLIIKRPLDILKIINKDKFIEILNRVKSTLPIVNDTNIQMVQNITNPMQISEIFAPNEIKLIIDKDNNIKINLIKSLSFQNIEAYFESIRSKLMGPELQGLVNGFVNEFLTNALPTITLNDSTIQTWITEVQI